VAFQVGFQRAQLKQVLFVEQPGLSPRRIEQGCRVAFRQNEAIVVGILGILRVVPHHGEEEHGDNVGG